MIFRQNYLNLRELPAQRGSQIRTDRVLRFKMSGIDEGQAERLRVGEGVVLAVCRDEGVAAHGSYAGQRVAAASAADRHAPHRPRTGHKAHALAA